ELNACACFQPEAPVRAAAFAFELRAVLIGQLQRRTVINRRQAASELDLAANLQFFGGLIAGVHPACGAQLLERRFIGAEAGGLAFLAVDLDAEPCEIAADAVRIFLAAAGLIRIVQPQEEAPA